MARLKVEGHVGLVRDKISNGFLILKINEKRQKERKIIWHHLIIICCNNFVPWSLLVHTDYRVND